MNNLILAFIISIISTFFIVITETKKENRVSVGIRSFIITYLVTFVALTYLINEGISCQDIEVGEPNF
jgi:hypothetical protein